MTTATTSMKTAIATVLGIAALACSVTAAGAFTLRVPQVVFASGALQAYLGTADGGINATTDQVDAQVFSTNYAGDNSLTLTLKNAGDAVVGIYNALDASPALHPIFPASATAGYTAVCHFDGTGGLTVALFDALNNPLGSTSYSGVDRNNFGLYILSSSGTFYSQDGRNGNAPQVLAYAGTGVNFGEWFLCFEPAPYNSGTSTFDGAVVVMQAIVPTPTRSTTWGALKSLYR